MEKVSRLRVACALAPAFALLVGCGGGKMTTGGSGGAGGHASSSANGGGGGAGGHASSSAYGSGGDIGFGTGIGSGGDGAVGSGGGACNGMLTVIVRDFTTDNHDFEPAVTMDDRAIVTEDLGSDGKPVYAGNPTTLTTTGKAAFDQWYNDTPGVNVTIPITINLAPGAGGIYTYNNQAFFPIDGQGLGDEGNNHNFHFTDEVHMVFTYKGGEVFTFAGDDDLFGYVNKKLVINLGGIHAAETASVNLDMVAAQIGLVVGQAYPLDLFGAERHVTESHYRIDTTIDCLMPPPPPQ